MFLLWINVETVLEAETKLFEIVDLLKDFPSNLTTWGIIQGVETRWNSSLNAWIDQVVNLMWCFSFGVLFSGLYVFISELLQSKKYSIGEILQTNFTTLMAAWPEGPPDSWAENW